MLDKIVASHNFCGRQLDMYKLTNVYHFVVHTSQSICILWFEINFKHIWLVALVFKTQLTVSIIFGRLILFYPSNDISTHPKWVLLNSNDGWMGLCIQP